MKHTPGEWLVYAKIFAKSAVISVMKSGGSKEIVHWTGFDASDFQRQNLANAHLISAAPNLLKGGRCLPRRNRRSGARRNQEQAARRNREGPIQMTPYRAEMQHNPPDEIRRIQAMDFKTVSPKKAFGVLQNLIGMAAGVTGNDRNPNRAADSAFLLSLAHQICIDVRSRWKA